MVTGAMIGFVTAVERMTEMIVDAFGRAWAKPELSPNACQTKVIDKERQQEAWNLCNVVT
jgi:hypothetical protein